MKSIKLKCTKVALALVLAVSSQASSAAIVFDPTNFVENLVTAIAAVKDEFNSAALLVNQVKQGIREVQNLRNMGAVGIAARVLDLEKELKAANAFKDAAKNLYSNLSDQKDYVVGVQKMVNVSGLSPAKWIEREKTLIKQRDSNATNLMKAGEAAKEAVEESQKARAQILADNDVDEGLRASVMKTNVLLGNVGGQMDTMLMLMKADIDVKASNQVMDSAKAKKESEGREFINNRIKAQEAVPLFK